MKISHLTVAISVALGLTACGGSGSDTTVNNTVPTTPTTPPTTPTTPTTPEEPSDGPDVVKEAERQAPGMTPEARFVGDIAAQKALYTGRNDRQSLGGFQDYNAAYTVNNRLDTARNRAYAGLNFKPTQRNLVETHYVQGTTKVADALRSGAIYNYVEKGHLVGTGLFSAGTGVASSNPGAVVADPGFTYAKGSDDRYYRMMPVGANWNNVSAGTRYVPVDNTYRSQFGPSGDVGQSELVFIPNAREVGGQLADDVNNLAGSAVPAGRTLTSRTDGSNNYDYRSTGLPSIDGRRVPGGVDRIDLAGDEDRHSFRLNNLVITNDTTSNPEVIIRVDVEEDSIVTNDVYVNRRTNAQLATQFDAVMATAPRNTYVGIARGSDPTGNSLFTIVPSTNAANGGGQDLNPFEAGALVAIEQENRRAPAQATDTPDDVIRLEPVVVTVGPGGNYTFDAGVTVVDEASGTILPDATTINLPAGTGPITIDRYVDSNGNEVYTQQVNYAPGVSLTPTQNVYSTAKAGQLRFSDFPALLAFDGNTATTVAGANSGDLVTADLLNDAVSNFAPVLTGNAFDTNRGVVEWQHLTMLGNDYDLASNVTSKVNQLDFSSLKVAKEIQDVPLTVTYTTKGTKGTQSTGDDKNETQTVEAGMLKVYNLPYHRSFVNINQDAVDNNPRNRGFYDAFNLAGDGVGNGRFGALHVTGVQTQGVPWNGRAEYTGSSYGIYTDGQYVKGDIELAAEFGKDRAQVLGTVKNRTLADGTTAPDMALERIPLVGSTGTQNYDTGTRAMNNSSRTPAGAVTIGGVLNAGIWEFQLYGPNAEEIGGLIKYGNQAPITGQLQPDYVRPAGAAAGPNPNAAGDRVGGYNEVFSAQRKDISVTSNQSQIPTK